MRSIMIGLLLRSLIRCRSSCSSSSISPGTPGTTQTTPLHLGSATTSGVTRRPGPEPDYFGRKCLTLLDSSISVLRIDGLVGSRGSSN
ncbi:uncharacterized protein BO87DRAFT_119880 [Aspergillus neoniger CBS 115656]|uniref:Secreted protein n=1 Tax=Aspergillus neoniger (strain CBS 115656) TaxID=1448310 RepID=A0A318YV61_ASPNB|nr:hypothetical protein BO87DRAFT_119880 [Aspergillus neoniger CBS 115656]PYH31768.1 hypothetical protein BO87DRAFT_119880 [Aspergillus neoniger CBS 115656]